MKRGHGLLTSKVCYFKSPALKKSRHRPNFDRDYTGGAEFPLQGVSFSHDQRRRQNIDGVVQVDDEDDSLYAAMILDQEACFRATEAADFSCEDTSSECVQVNRPFVVYVSLSTSHWLLRNRL